MKQSTRPATLAEAEAVDHIGDDDDDDDDSDGAEADDDDYDGEEGGIDGSSVLPTFDVPYLRFIDEEEVDDFGGEGRSDCGVGVGGGGGGWPVADECCGGASPCRYVVVSGTPLKILEHLLSDLRLDEERGAPESRDSGE